MMQGRQRPAVKLENLETSPHLNQGNERGFSGERLSLFKNPTMVHGPPLEKKKNPKGGQPGGVVGNDGQIGHVQGIGPTIGESRTQRANR
ncbi:MAG: hypothetical protein CM1200mP41_30130 [Gammaproteobacteria bacterium]|nr:MAG: hypothetical protein CM1200mP41_30130 [Gammaproteobacteria bacterium]